MPKPPRITVLPIGVYVAAMRGCQLFFDEWYNGVVSGSRWPLSMLNLTMRLSASWSGA
jgi:hypothetical protein